MSGQARAEWLEASTRHFVIDADTTEARINDFATRLERFDAALRHIYGIGDNPSLHSNRVRVYATGSGTIATIAQSTGSPANTAGFYHQRAGGSVIFTAALTGVTSIGGARNLALDPQEVLLHEYSHHFMYSNFPNVPVPMWFSEGFAEFNGNVLFQPDGSLYVGLPANYRAWGLRSGVRLPMRSLMAPSPADLRDDARHDLIYGRGWLLTHYLMLDDRLRPRLDAYQKAVAGGTPSIAAAETAFGNLNTLDGALDRYRDHKLNTPLFIKAEGTPAVEIQRLSPGAAAMMPVHMRSTAGVDRTMALRLYPNAVSRAAPFAHDPRVQVELAEAAFDAGHDDVADAAADKALDAEPANLVALEYKGRVACRRLATAKSTDGFAWKAARRWYVKANRADTEAAMPLVLYYASFVQEGAAPPKLAVDGLVKAQGLAPEDGEVRLMLARQLILEDALPDARRLLQPLAYAPHGRGEENLAQRLIGLIDAGDAAIVRAAIEKPVDDQSPEGKATPSRSSSAALTSSPHA